jgi:hypothetical protein
MSLKRPSSKQRAAATSVKPSGRRQRAGEKSPLEIRKQLSGAPTRAAATSLQRVQDADEVLVADALELADRQAGGLFVRLGGDLLDQGLVKVDDVGEFAPWPFGARADWARKWRMPASPPAMR